MGGNKVDKKRKKEEKWVAKVIVRDSTVNDNNSCTYLDFLICNYKYSRVIIFKYNMAKLIVPNY